MKKVLLSIATLVLANIAFAQTPITITAGDVPVSGDTLRYSTVLGLTSGINVNDSGTNKAWVYDTLKPLAQTVDNYQSATAVNFTYGLTISATAYGYKIADSIPGLGSLMPGLTIKNVYTFFNKRTTPGRFVAEAFAALIGGAPIPANYSDEDEIYFFPLTYPHATDSSTFAVNVSIPTLGSLKRAGYRKTWVDGWGTIKTPYYTTAVRCIRVRSEIHEVDTIHITTPITFNYPIVMDTVEYKWLVNGDHYPALWVTQSKHTAQLTSVTYRDSIRHGLVNVSNTPKLTIQEIKAYPNPITNGLVTIDVPAGWNNFTVYVYDAVSRMITTFANKNELNIAALAPGKYYLLVKSGDNIGYTQVIKQ